MRRTIEDVQPSLLCACSVFSFIFSERCLSHFQIEYNYALSTEPSKTTKATRMPSLMFHFRLLTFSASLHACLVVLRNSQSCHSCLLFLLILRLPLASSIRVHHESTHVDFVFCRRERELLVAGSPGRVPERLRPKVREP